LTGKGANSIGKKRGLKILFSAWVCDCYRDIRGISGMHKLPLIQGEKGIDGSGGNFR